MSYQVLAAVRREQRRVQVVLEAAAVDPDVPDSVVSLIRTARQELGHAADDLRKRLDREALQP